jgi:hypothetical protein
MTEPVVEKSGAEGFLEARLFHHKTMGRRRREAKRLLPVACVLPGVSCDWASTWLLNRKSVGLKASRQMPTMPAPILGGGFTAVPLTTGEASMWFRELFMHELDMEESVLQSFATHSCKATILSWLAKAGADVSIRRQAGFHADPADRSALEYSRDAQAPILQVIQRVYAAIQGGFFDPDCTRSGRWFGCSGLDEAIARIREGELSSRPRAADIDQGGSRQVGSDSEDAGLSVNSSVEEEETPSSDDEREARVAAASVAEAAEYDDEGLLSSGRVMCHVRSGFAHIVRLAEGPDEDGDLATFLCGRLCTANYSCVDSLKFLACKCSGCFK